MSALSQALSQLRAGGMVVLVDDEDRENEGDLVVAAQFATAEAVNFMASQGRGLICLALTGQQVDRLGLPAMTTHNRAPHATAFTISIEAAKGVTTGISAQDRSRTILAAANPEARPEDVVSPGHVFPLRAVDGGVLVRTGHTEGAIDLVRLAGLQPGAVICEIMREDGEMARRPELAEFAKEHSLPLLTIRDLALHRMATELLVEEVASASLPSTFASTPMRVHAFRSLVDGTEHLAIVKRPPKGVVPLVRVHSECLTGDALGSLRCDCGAQLQEALRLISASEGGALLYMREQESRGISLADKIRTYALQDAGQDTVGATTTLGFLPDRRDYGIAGQMLRALGMDEVSLLTNNPKKVDGLILHGVRVKERRPLVVASTPCNDEYLATKREKFGHLLCVQD